MKGKVQRVPGEPGQDLGMLVAAAAHDRVNHLAARHHPFDGVEEAQELLMAAARHAAADHRAVEHVEGGEPVVVPLRT